MHSFFAVQFYLVFKEFQLDKKINAKVDTLSTDVSFIKNRARVLSFEEALCIYTLYTGCLSFHVTEWVMILGTNRTVNSQDPDTFRIQITGKMRTIIDDSRQQLRLFDLVNGKKLSDVLEETNPSKNLFDDIEPELEKLRQYLSSQENTTNYIQQTLAALLLKLKLDAKEKFIRKLKEIYGESPNQE